jgi:hypothetical protein
MIGHADKGGPVRHEEADRRFYFLEIPAASGGYDLYRDTTARSFGKALQYSFHGGDSTLLRTLARGLPTENASEAGLEEKGREGADSYGQDNVIEILGWGSLD